MLHAKNTSSSTAIERIAYDTITSVLTVTFRTGKSYDYDGVPLNVYNALLSSTSTGHYFTTYIKGNYPQRYATGTKRQII